MKKKSLEIELQKQIVEMLNKNGFFVWRSNSGLAFFVDKHGKQRAFRAGFKGCSDIIGCTPNGNFVAIEVKIGKNKPSEAQEEFIYEIQKRSSLAFVAYSLEDVASRFDIKIK